MQLTELLQRVHAGDEEALRAVVPLVYEELKRLAANRLRREVGSRTLETTALVHEAFVRLAGSQHPAYESRAHFYAIASRVMRQILVDSARSRTADKRDIRLEVALSGLRDVGMEPDQTLLAVNEALERLAQSDPLKARLIEMRYFGGMTAEETATALSMSVHTVRHSLRAAQAWLHKELAQ